MNKNNCYCVIMAGGAGTRFWPLSRAARPKQFLDVADTGKTFIRQTYERFLRVIPQENILVVSSAKWMAGPEVTRIPAPISLAMTLARVVLPRPGGP